MYFSNLMLLSLQEIVTGKEGAVGRLRRGRQFLKPSKTADIHSNFVVQKVVDASHAFVPIQQQHIHSQDTIMRIAVGKPFIRICAMCPSLRSAALEGGMASAVNLRDAFHRYTC